MRPVQVSLAPLVTALVFVGAWAMTAAVTATTLHRGLGPGLDLLAATVAVAVAVLCFRSFATCRRSIDLAGTDLWAVVLLVTYAAWQFAFVVFARGDVVETLTPYNYGDLPLHWTYVANLVRGAAFWPESPILTGHALRYPLGSDLISAMLVQCGLPLDFVWRVSGIAFAAALALTLAWWGRGFAVLAFLFSGGILGLRFFVSFALVDANADMAWKNLFLALFLPQRGFLFALPAGLLLLGSWRERFLEAEGRPLPSVAEGLLLAVLPLFHLHTFAFVSILGGVWALCGGPRRGLRTLAIALAPATWAVWTVTDGFRAAGVVWWKAGWMVGKEGVGDVLLVNFAPWLVLWILALVRAVRVGSRTDRVLLVSGLSGFVLFFFLMLAPWEWDNTKVFAWCFLLTVPPVYSLILARLASWARAVLVLLLALPQAPNLVAAARETQGPRLELVHRDEMAQVCEATGTLPVQARVAVEPTYNHPVALCGQPIVAGYAGHLWSHGYDSKAVEEDLRTLLDGAPGWQEAARRVRAEYVFFGPRERAQHPRSTWAWLEGGRVIRAGRYGVLVRLSEP